MADLKVGEVASVKLFLMVFLGAAVGAMIVAILTPVVVAIERPIVAAIPRQGAAA